MATSSLTIEELSERSGVSTRNIRAFQSRRLLPAPQRVGRVGYYGAEHLERLRLITSLQGRTFGLPAIAELLDPHKQHLRVSELLGVEAMLTPRFVEEDALVVSKDRLGEIFPDLVLDPFLLERAIKLGLVASEGEEFRIPSPQILEAGGKLAASGVPGATILDEAEWLQQDCMRIAKRFYDLVKPSILRQLLSRQPRPMGRVLAVLGVLDELQPLAAATVDSFLRWALDDVGDRLRSRLPDHEQETRAGSRASVRGPTTGSP